MWEEKKERGKFYMENFWVWWQHIPEKINPVIFHAGIFQIRYYGLMYILAFVTVYLLVLYRIKTEKLKYSKDTILDFMFWGILAVLVGGRLGYVFFYELKYYLAHPLNIIIPFDFSNGVRYIGISGMSYHGGVIAMVIVFLFFCHKNKIKMFEFSDLIVSAAPIAYTFGRLGNFINGELYGRITKVPWGMYFPMDMSGHLRHPSQLYEAFFEGIFLFIIVWSLRKQKVFNGFISGIYLIGYGTVRFFIEFVREPDPQLGFVLGSFTMGQILCFLMILGGLLVLFLGERKRARR